MFCRHGLLGARGRAPGAAARARRPGRAAAGLRGRPAQPAAPSRSGLRAHRLSLRVGHGLRRVPRSAAAPHADDRVAAASGSRSATTCRRWWRSRVWPSEYDAAIARAEDLYRSLAADFLEQASYAVALAHRIRYVMQMNAREAMHLIELRSGTQGHPAYRRVAQQMHRAIAETAGHRAIAESMSFRRAWLDRPGTARIGAAGGASPGRKICDALTRKYPRSPWLEDPHSS